MAIHDRRYKRILTSSVFAYDVARLLADQFNLGTVDRQSLQAGPTSSVRESEHERIADSAWTFDTDRQRTVMMIVEAQSSRRHHLAVRLLRHVVDRLLEMCEDRQRYDPAQGLPPVVVAVLHTGPDRWQPPSLQELFSPLARALMRFDFPLPYYDVRHTDRRDYPEPALLRMVFDIERAGDPSETVPVAEAVKALADREAHELMTRFLSDKMRQWAGIRDARGRYLVEAARLDDSRPLKEVEREMETIQERFNRLMDERHTEGRSQGRTRGTVPRTNRGTNRGTNRRTNRGPTDQLPARLGRQRPGPTPGGRCGSPCRQDGRGGPARHPLRPGRHSGRRTAPGSHPGRGRTDARARRTDLGPATPHPGRGHRTGVARPPATAGPPGPVAGTRRGPGRKRRRRAVRRRATIGGTPTPKPGGPMNKRFAWELRARADLRPSTESEPPKAGLRQFEEQRTIPLPPGSSFPGTIRRSRTPSPSFSRRTSRLPRTALEVQTSRMPKSSLPPQAGPVCRRSSCPTTGPQGTSGRIAYCFDRSLNRHFQFHPELFKRNCDTAIGVVPVQQWVLAYQHTEPAQKRYGPQFE